jgi:hypothetical protein
MGYLGSDLDDYYSYQLVEKVIEQIEKGDMGDINKLTQRLKTATEKLFERKVYILSNIKKREKPKGASNG